MTILLIDQRASPDQITAMLAEYESMIKIVVDVRRGLLSGGGHMHSDCEADLLANLSEQDDLWGANWYPGEQRIEYESLINIRPALGNRGIIIQDEALRQKMLAITHNLLGGVS